MRRATLYKHFRDKDDLLVHIVQEQVRRFTFQNRVPFDPRRLGAYYTGMFESLLGFLEENAAVSRAVFGGVGEPSRTRHHLGGDGGRHGREASPVGFRGARAYGDPDMIAAMHIGAVMECARWWILRGGHLSREEVVRQFGNVMMRF